MNNKKTQQFLKLVSENPELPILPLVNYEICLDEGGYWKGSFGQCGVEEYATYNECFYTEKEELKEQYFDDNRDFFEGLSEEKVEELLEKKTGHWWIKAIIVYIEFP